MLEKRVFASLSDMIFGESPSRVEQVLKTVTEIWAYAPSQES